MAKPKSLPPWLQEAKAEKPDAKVSGAKGPKGSVTKVTVPVKKADGGKIDRNAKNAAVPKSQARSDPKMAGNAKGNVLHLKNGGKA